MKSTKTKPAKQSKARKPAKATPATVPQPSVVEIMAQEAGANAATHAANVIRDAVKLYGVPDHPDAIRRTFTEGTPEYFNRHAARAERDGDGHRWFVFTERAERMDATERLAAKQIVRTPFVENETVMLADAVSLLTPKQLAEFQRLRHNRKLKIDSRGFIARTMRPIRPAA